MRMPNVLDEADRAYLWLREHLAVAAVLAVAFVAFAVFVLTSGGGDDGEPKIPAGSVAVVGSAPITGTQLTHWQGVYTTGATASGATAPTPAQARKAAFELLAGAQWVLEEAREQEVTVTEQQVTDSIDAYFKQAGVASAADRATLQRQLGTTDADMRFQQRVSLLAAKLQTRAADKAPKPTAAQVAEAYAKEPGRWATPSTRDLRAVVATDRAAADKARAALEKGGAFAAVSKQYSGNASLTKAEGIISGLKNGSGVDNVDRAVFSAEPGVLTGPIDTGAGWMVFKVQKSTPLPPQSLQQATKAITANLLGAAKVKAGGAYLKQLRDRWKARTRCTAAVTSPQFCGAVS